MKANNKRYLNILLIALSVSSITSTSYQPASGPLKLADSYVQNPQNPYGPLIIQRGSITGELLRNNVFINQKMDVYDFMGIPQTVNLPLYQDIVQAIANSTDTERSTKAIEAFEDVIMHLVRYKEYVYTLDPRYSKGFLLTGIRRLSWEALTLSFSEETKQLMHELKNLSKVAEKHNLMLSWKLSQKAENHLNMASRTIIAGLAAATLYYNKEYLAKLGAKALISTGNYLGQGLTSVGNNALELVKSGGDYIGQGTTSAYEFGRNSAKDILNSIYNTGTNRLGSIYNYGAESLGSAYQTGLNSLSSTTSAISNQLNTLKNMQINPTWAAAAGGALGGFGGGYVAGTYRRNNPNQENA